MKNKTHANTPFKASSTCFVYCKLDEFRLKRQNGKTIYLGFGNLTALETLKFIGQEKADRSSLKEVTVVQAGPLLGRTFLVRLPNIFLECFQSIADPFVDILCERRIQVNHITITMKVNHNTSVIAKRMVEMCADL